MDEQTRQVIQIIDEVKRGESTIGQLQTVNAMYPPHYTADDYLNCLRKALRILLAEQQQACSAA